MFKTIRSTENLLKQVLKDFQVLRYLTRVSKGCQKAQKKGASKNRGLVKVRQLFVKV